MLHSFRGSLLFRGTPWRSPLRFTPQASRHDEIAPSSTIVAVPLMLRTCASVDPGTRHGRSMSTQARMTRADWIQREKQHKALIAEKKRSTMKSGLREVLMPERCSAKQLSAVLQVRTVNVLKDLILLGIYPESAHEPIDDDIADMIAEAHYWYPVREKDRADVDIYPGMHPLRFGDERYPRRPPVVVVVGHVDHGKTSLLDHLRKSNVAAREAGNITQTIAAFSVQQKPEHGGGLITFLDTPGHEAFVSIRQRGVRATDIAVLVIAIDDGVQEQTIESIKMVQENDVPFIIALNKVDKEGADAMVEKVEKELLQHGIMLEKHGGDIQSVEISALKGLGMDELIDSILLQAEFMDLRTEDVGPAECTVIEAQRHHGIGTIGSIIVQAGRLQKGDAFVSGSVWGRVRRLIDCNGRTVSKAGPSTPVTVIGFKGTQGDEELIPQPGEDLMTVAHERMARRVVEYRLRNKDREKSREAQEKHMEEEAEQQRRAAEEAEMEEEEEVEEEEDEGPKIPALTVVLRADAIGTVEAIMQAIEGLPQENVKVNIAADSVGEVTENDVLNAKTHTPSLLIAFNTKVPAATRKYARMLGVDIMSLNVIYSAIDSIVENMEKLLPPLLVPSVVGEAKVIQTFEVTGRRRKESVIGCMINKGKISRGLDIRIFRKLPYDDELEIEPEEEVWSGKMLGMKHYKRTVTELVSGNECGIQIPPKVEVREGDIVQSVVYKEQPQKLFEGGSRQRTIRHR